MFALKEFLDFQLKLLYFGYLEFLKLEIKVRLPDESLAMVSKDVGWFPIENIWFKAFLRFW